MYICTPLQRLSTYLSMIVFGCFLENMQNNEKTKMGKPFQH